MHVHQREFYNRRRVVVDRSLRIVVRQWITARSNREIRRRFVQRFPVRYGLESYYGTRVFERFQNAKRITVFRRRTCTVRRLLRA